MSRLIPAALLALATACGGLPTEYSIDPRFTELEAAAIDGAADAWAEASDGLFALELGSGGDLAIWRETGPGPDGETFEGGWFRTRWVLILRPADPCPFQRVAAHELGHVVLGPRHLPEGLMAPDSGRAMSIDAHAVADLIKRHGPCASCAPAPLPACEE